jgi:hypothetical protein
MSGGIQLCGHAALLKLRSSVLHFGAERPQHTRSGKLRNIHAVSPYREIRVPAFRRQRNRESDNNAPEHARSARPLLFFHGRASRRPPIHRTRSAGGRRRLRLTKLPRVQAEYGPGSTRRVRGFERDLSRASCPSGRRFQSGPSRRFGRRRRSRRLCHSYGGRVLRSSVNRLDVPDPVRFRANSLLGEPQRHIAKLACAIQGTVQISVPVPRRFFCKAARIDLIHHGYTRKQYRRRGKPAANQGELL